MTQSSLVTIGTHDGSFHCDDVLAVAILSTIYPNHQVVRSRDQDILDILDIVVDVGGAYDHHTMRYDHHLHNPPKDRHNNLLSSAGLIWRHYSRAYLKSIGMPADFDVKGVSYDLLTAVEQSMLKFWIRPIDQSDNGLSNIPTPISELVRSMRPTDPEKSHARFDAQFIETVGIVSMLFKRSCFHAADWMITKMTCNSEEIIYHNNDQIAVSVHPVNDYKRFSGERVHFVICPVRPYKDEKLQYVIRPITDEGHIYRTPFPSTMWGRRKEYIETVNNVKGISYIHHTGFMAFADTVEDAVAFCQQIMNTQ
jgi:uncharacterized UPF0160 family protein